MSAAGWVSGIGCLPSALRSESHYVHVSVPAVPSAYTTTTHGMCVVFAPWGAYRCTSPAAATRSPDTVAFSIDGPGSLFSVVNPNMTRCVVGCGRAGSRPSTGCWPHIDHAMELVRMQTSCLHDDCHTEKTSPLGPPSTCVLPPRLVRLRAILPGRHGRPSFHFGAEEECPS